MMAQGTKVVCHLVLQVKFNTVTPIHLHIVYGYFCDKMAELSSGNSEHIAEKF